MTPNEDAAVPLDETLVVPRESGATPVGDGSAASPGAATGTSIPSAPVSAVTPPAGLAVNAVAPVAEAPALPSVAFDAASVDAAAPPQEPTPADAPADAPAPVPATSDADRVFTPLKEGEASLASQKDSWRFWLSNKANGWTSIEDAQRDLGFSTMVQPKSPPTEGAVQALRQNRDNPVATEVFEERYGPGTAAQYLRFAKGDHIALIAGPHPSKQAIEVFDEMYGPGMAYWYNMFASNNLAARTRAANEIRSMLMEGKNFSQEFETGATGNFFRGLERGPAEAQIGRAHV